MPEPMTGIGRMKRCLPRHVGVRIAANVSICSSRHRKWSTVYLRAVVDDSTGYDYDISEVYKNYEDIEFFGEG